MNIIGGSISSGRTTMNGLLYRIGEGAGLAAVLVSILLWGNIASLWLH